MNTQGLDFSRGGVDVVYDSLWGSCGKGKICGWLAGEIGQNGKGEIPYALSVTVASPNSGHTVWDKEGSSKIALQQVPVSAKVDTRIRCLLAAGSLIDVPLLMKEIRDLGLTPTQLGIDAAAGIVEDRHVHGEMTADLVKRIGSTGHGVGAARAERLMRHPEFKLAYQIEELKPFLTNVAQEINIAVKAGRAVLLEGGQGTLLSHNISGPDGKPFYPYCTSRVGTVSGFMSDTLIAPKHIRNVIGVVRTYPIRVAGNSGPFYAKELTWAEVSQEAGFVEPIQEVTTVTKKIRRVAELSFEALEVSNMVNQPDAIALTFADYIDASVAGADRWDGLTSKAMTRIREIEERTQIPVWLIGTGQKHSEMIRRF